VEGLRRESRAAGGGQEGRVEREKSKIE